VEQVERWLETEPQMQQSYQQLVNLRAGMSDMPMPVSCEPVETFVAQVFSRIDAEAEMERAWEARKAKHAEGQSEKVQFELLSAYIDGEATVSQRQQVQEWLDRDPEVKRLYFQLLKLRQGVQVLPVPAPEQTAEQTATQVFRRVDRRRHRRMAWGGGAIAALFMAALSSVMPPVESPPPQQVASSPSPVREGQERLSIALNGPVVDIPEETAKPEPEPTVSRALFVE
jgi:anti-sigma factor RsiW